MSGNDRKFRAPRIFSNVALREIAAQCHGDVVNVSAWRDEDKEGARYKDYFPNADTYSITNYVSDARGFQGDLENEIFLDLTKPLPEALYKRFDIVLNHTVLEHVFEINTAFTNLCLMSRSRVIIVVPFLQEQHAHYGDYWRFTPLCVEKLFHVNHFKLEYINYNDQGDASIYIVASGVCENYDGPMISHLKDNKIHYISDSFIGRSVIKNGSLSRLRASIAANVGRVMRNIGVRS
tara:strand:- start:345 stop:1052 length:708 start_codon:yes stop_codon:yes gene_type:complete